MRDRMIDGYRGVAVLCVVAAHSLSYRFQPGGPSGLRLAQFANPLAEMGVQLFFVISGYIITTLLIREETRSGRISVAAFYVRRFFRILPPLAVYYVALFCLRAAGFLSFDGSTIRNSSLFTCNTGFTACDWWVAHTWSLAVEEQFYLAWPLLIVFLGSKRRVPFLALLIASLLGAFLIVPYQWHSNWISFSCIAAGALYSLSAKLRETIKRVSSYPLWLASGLLFAMGPVFLIKTLLVLTPFLILFILFASRELPFVLRILESRPLQSVGAVSYSLYLWQQVFLGRPVDYAFVPQIIFLPFAVALSYWLIERPCARLGHRVSDHVKAHRVPAVVSPI